MKSREELKDEKSEQRKTSKTDKEINAQDRQKENGEDKEDKIGEMQGRTKEDIKEKNTTNNLEKVELEFNMEAKIGFRNPSFCFDQDRAQGRSKKKATPWVAA